MAANNKRGPGLFEKAISSEDLIERAGGNQRYASGDFNGWVKSLFDGLNFSSVLDVCCGTGNQLVLYGMMPQVSLIAGVDISEEALEVARKRLKKIDSHKKLILKHAKMEEMFTDSDLSGLKFDLISCFYGLYYSKSVENTVTGMIEHLSNNGRLIIVGPYGENNAELFKLLNRHFTLPEPVKKSSSTFMEEDLYPILSKSCDVRKKTFVNRINYPDSAALVKYWKATTFYFPEFEQKIIEDLEAHFSHNKEFVVEKHVMAYIARKKV